jgi:hypothetical protein
MELFKDTHLVKLELLSNATTIDSALNYMRNKQQQEQAQHKKGQDLDSTRDGNNHDQLTQTGGIQTVF